MILATLEKEAKGCRSGMKRTLFFFPHRERGGWGQIKQREAKSSPSLVLVMRAHTHQWFPAGSEYTVYPLLPRHHHLGHVLTQLDPRNAANFHQLINTTAFVACMSTEQTNKPR